MLVALLLFLSLLLRLLRLLLLPALEFLLLLLRLFALFLLVQGQESRNHCLGCLEVLLVASEGVFVTTDLQEVPEVVLLEGKGVEVELVFEYLVVVGVDEVEPTESRGCLSET